MWNILRKNLSFFFVPQKMRKKRRKPDFFFCIRGSFRLHPERAFVDKILHQNFKFEKTTNVLASLTNI
jgi:hypothetical protein